MKDARITPSMTCERFGVWLGAGRPAAGANAAATHAVSCARCGAALAADRAIDAMLAVPAAGAPAGFTERVMRAVELANETRAHASAPAWNDAMPWWARAAMQPSTIGAAALAAALVWRPGAIEQGGRLGLTATFSAWQGLGSWAAQVFGPAGVAIAASPVVQLGIAGSAALLLALAALPLYRWTERVALRGVA